MLNTFLSLPTASGAETRIADAVCTALEKGGVTLSKDALGNVHGIKNAGADGEKVSVFCAMDAPGVVVTFIEENGNARVSPLGKIPFLAACMHRLTNQAGTVSAVLIPDNASSDSFEKAHVEYAGEALSQGDILCFCDGVTVIDENKMVATAFGNKLCTAAICELMLKEALPESTELHAAFCTQTVLGNRGAAPAAAGFSKDTALCVQPYDGTTFGVKLCDKSFVCDKAVTQRLIRAAKACGIDLTPVAENSTVSDAAFIKSASCGAKTAVLLVPVKACGGIKEMGDPKDAGVICRILEQFLLNK